jgi:eukaryotic-like serine/threonine-protein kinase
MDTPSRLTLRIFISSPGDVPVERDRAADVVARLQEEFVHYALLEPYFWEDQPARATDTFQSQFPEASGMDIVVGILWARIGTPLPLDRARPDGRRYESGTVYELETAAESYRARGVPDLVIYRRISDPPLPLHDEAERQRRLEQLEALEAFIRRWFFHDDGSFKAAFHTFKTPDQFEQQLETHLRKLIRDKVEKAEQPGGPGEGEIVFHGVPYPGLKVFGLEDAPVFYGRARALAAVKEALQAQAGRNGAFLLIFGMSGSGKSSLVRAGLVHALTATPGWIEGVDLWRWCLVRPGDTTGDPVDALAQAFFGDTALPELRAGGIDAARLARTLRDNPDDVDLILGPALRAVADSERERRAADRPLTARLLVVVDQLEELFTRDWLDEPARTRYVAALAAQARCGLMWLVATMRSEFFARCAELPELAALKAGQGQLDLLPPTFAEIGQMIRYPARDAALRWGRDPDNPGQALDDVLQEAAWRAPKALPLLQFTLNELFRRRDGRMLICEAYRAVGGLEGALANHAEATLAALPPEVQDALPALLRALVTAGENDHEPVVSRRVPLEPLRVDPIRRRLLDVLIDARLLLTDRDDQMQPVAGIAHEALLTHWPRLKDLLNKDREFLRARARAASAAERWRRESRHVDFLLHEGRPLAEARELLNPRRDDLDRETIEFINQSIRYRTRQRRRLKRAIATISGIVLSLVLALVPFGFVEWRDALDQKQVSLGQKLEAEKQRSAADAQARKIADEKTALAVRQRDLALQAVNKLTYDIPERFRNIPGTIPTLRSILEDNVTMLDRIVELEPDTRQAEWEKASNFSGIGDRWLLLGDTRRALEAYEQSLAIFLKLGHDENTAQAQRDLSVSYNKLGDVRVAMNDLADAREAYEKSLAIRLKLARDETNSEAQRDLAVSYNKLGNVRVATHDLAGAREVYEKGLALALKLARDVTNAQAQRDLFVSYNKLGDTCMATNDLAGASEAYEKSLALAVKLARDVTNAQAQRDLAVSYEKLGNVRTATNDVAGAREVYKKFREQALWLDQAFMGDILGSNAQTQRDLAVDYDRLGDGRKAKNDLPGARHAYEKSLEIRLKLGRNETNAQAQRDLAVSYNRLGDIRMAMNDLEGALAVYEKGLAIHLKLARDVTNSQAQRDLWISYDKLGDVRAGLNDWARACETYEHSLAICERFLRTHPQDPEFLSLRDQARSALAGAVARLGDHARASRLAGEIAERQLGSIQPVYRAACAFSLSVSAASRDDKLSAQEKSRLADQYASRALERLKRLQADGAFKNAKYLELLKTDTDLDSLRGHAEFKKLIAEIEAETKTN